MPQISKRDGHSSEIQPHLGTWTPKCWGQLHSRRASKTTDNCRHPSGLWHGRYAKRHLRQRLYTLSNNRWNSISTCHNSRQFLLRFCSAHNLKRFPTLGSYTLPNLAAIEGVSIQKLLCFLKRTNYFAKSNNTWAREKDLPRDHVASQGAQCSLSVGISI